MGRGKIPKDLGHEFGPVANALVYVAHVNEVEGVRLVREVLFRVVDFEAAVGGDPGGLDWADRSARYEKTLRIYTLGLCRLLPPSGMRRRNLHCQQRAWEAESAYRLPRSPCQYQYPALSVDPLMAQYEVSLSGSGGRSHGAYPAYTPPS